jgi:hypothetical protein
MNSIPVYPRRGRPVLGGRTGGGSGGASGSVARMSRINIWRVMAEYGEWNRKGAVQSRHFAVSSAPRVCS